MFQRFCENRKRLGREVNIIIIRINIKLNSEAPRIHKSKAVSGSLGFRPRTALLAISRGIERSETEYQNRFFSDFQDISIV